MANSLGNGIVIPFLIIYLHDVRHFSLGTSGLVVAVLLGIGLVGSPLAGRVVDRVGARTTLMVSLATARRGLRRASRSCASPGTRSRSPWSPAPGTRGFAPSHSSLLASLTSREQRTAAYALTRVTDNLGFGIGGLDRRPDRDHAGARELRRCSSRSTRAPSSPSWACCCSCRPRRSSLPRPGCAAATRRSCSDRPFVWLLALTAILVAAAYAQISTTLPPFVKDNASVSEAGIGVIFLVNTIVLVVAQLPIAKAVEGRRRLRALSLTGAIFSGTCLLILFAGSWFENATAVAAPVRGDRGLQPRRVHPRGGQQPARRRPRARAPAGPLHGAANLRLAARIPRRTGDRESSCSPARPRRCGCVSAGACAVAAVGFLLLEPRHCRSRPRELRARNGLGSKAFRVLWRTPTVILDDPLSTNAEPSPPQRPHRARGAGGRHTP